MTTMMTIETYLLTYDKPSKAFIGEISTVENAHDKLEQTVFVRSHTGTKVAYYLTQRVFDNEGDLVKYVFMPVSTELDRVPGCRGTSLVLFND